MPTPRTEIKKPLDDEIYEEVNALNVTPLSDQDFHPLLSHGESCSSLFDTSTSRTPSPTDTYVSVSEFQRNLNEYENDTNKRENLFEPTGNGRNIFSSVTPTRGVSEYSYEYCNDYSLRHISNPGNVYTTGKYYYL